MAADGGAVTGGASLNESFAERGIIASVVEHPHILSTVREALDPSDFLREKHRIVWRSICEVDDSGIPPVWDVLLEHLSAAGDLPKVGGVSGLAEIIDGVPRSDDVSPLVRMVRRLSLDRRVASELEQVGLALADKEQPSEVLVEHWPKLTKLQEQATAAAGSNESIVDSLGCTGAELATREAAEVDWIARGYVGVGSTTEVIGRIKEGKTTFELALIRACLFGGDFIGHHVDPRKVLIVTEQGEVSFRAQAAAAGILGSENLTIIFKHELMRFSWEQRVALVMAKAAKVGATVVFWDTFGALAGLKDDGENGDEAGRKMRDLSEAAAVSRRAIVALRHARKSGGDASDAGRGFSGISGAVDIVLLLKKSATNQGPNIRELEAVSRFSETPANVVIELVGQHYRLLGDAGDIRRNRNETAILEALPREPQTGLTLADLEAKTELKRATVQRTLADLREREAVKITGRGTKNDPKRYCKPQVTFCPFDSEQQTEPQGSFTTEFNELAEMLPTYSNGSERQSGRNVGGGSENDCAHTIGIVCGQHQIFPTQPVDSPSFSQNDAAQTTSPRVGTIISLKERSNSERVLETEIEPRETERRLW
jgi:hypothetical protein